MGKRIMRDLTVVACNSERGSITTGVDAAAAVSNLSF
jgi:hypothetical protein